MRGVGLRLLLVVVILVQPVAAQLAMSTAVPCPTEISQNTMNHHEAMTVSSGHIDDISVDSSQPDLSKTAQDHTQNCCGDMASSADCVASCSAVACAISTFSSGDNLFVHTAARVISGVSYSYQSLSGLFRPPRIS